jgi:hypothetical protein
MWPIGRDHAELDGPSRPRSRLRYIILKGRLRDVRFGVTLGFVGWPDVVGGQEEGNFCPSRTFGLWNGDTVRHGVPRSITSSERG